MKILHLIDSGGLYGAEKVLLMLTKLQLEHGHQPMILSVGELNVREKPLESEAQKLDLPITSWRMRAGLNLVAARRILTWAQRQGYQVLHSHGYKFNILLGLWPRNVRRIPLVTTLHGYVQAPRWTKMAAYEALDRWILPKLDAVILVNPNMTNIPAISRVDASRLHIIPNGLAPVSSNSITMPPLLKKFCSRFRYKFVAIGRLSREKGFDILLKAFAQIADLSPEVGLAIIGEGNERPNLETLATQLDIDSRVILPGYIDQTYALLSNFDCLVIPSRTEGLPITLLEAMQARVPIIASDVGAISSVLDHGRCGHIVPLNQVNSLAKALLTSISQTKLSNKMAEKAFNRLQEKYTAEIMGGQYIEVYTQSMHRFNR